MSTLGVYLNGSFIHYFFYEFSCIKAQETQGRVQAIFEGGPTVKFADKISEICRQILKYIPTEFILSNIILIIRPYKLSVLG